MGFRRHVVVLASAAFLAVTGSAMASPAAPAEGVTRDPAPPPSSCRMKPSDIWASLLTSNAAPDLVAYEDYRTGLASTATGTGKGVRIGDIEYEWLASHVELAAKNLPKAAATGLPPEYQARDHGTAVLGLLGGTADGKGITGIAPDATLLPVSPFFGTAYKPREAIAAAAAGLGPGDVLLIELQAQVPGNGPMVPIEAYPEVRAAIRDAVDKGIVVVEPSANSGLDLATVSLGALGANPWDLGTATEDDSGALLVGAGGSGSDLLSGALVGDRERTVESNFGDRVDLQGYGAGVVTSGYADLRGLTDDSSYTACFDGTSSASATVAGAVAVVQGEAIARYGAPLTPAQMRALLVKTGRPQVFASRTDGSIGPRPQIAAAVAAIPSVRDEGPPVIGPSIPRVEVTPTTPVQATPPPVGAAPSPVRTPVASGASALSITAAAARQAPLARLNRRTGLLTITLRGLAPAARITVKGRRVSPRRGVVVIITGRARVFTVGVTAPARAGTTYRPARFTITIRKSGALRVARLR